MARSSLPMVDAVISHLFERMYALTDDVMCEVVQVLNQSFSSLQLVTNNKTYQVVLIVALIGRDWY